MVVKHSGYSNVLVSDKDKWIERKGLCVVRAKKDIYHNITSFQDLRQHPEETLTIYYIENNDNVKLYSGSNGEAFSCQV